MKKIFSIGDDFVNARLDRWFKKSVCNVPQSLIEKNIRKGNIKVGNKKKKSNYRLQKDDQINVSNFNFKPNINIKKRRNIKLVKKKYFHRLACLLRSIKILLL